MSGDGQPLRILIAKPGLDGHDRGAKVIARGLRDAGMEVIYSGLRQTADMIVNAAIQEDVQAIGLSVLSGAHMRYFTEVLDGLRERDAGDILLFGGGIVPDEDAARLREQGVGRIFTPGSSMQEVVGYINDTVADAR